MIIDIDRQVVYIICYRPKQSNRWYNMLRVNQEEEGFELVVLTNNDRQEDKNSLLEKAEIIYKNFEDESVTISRTPEQFSKK
jgi:hypothetical protein